MYGAMCVCPPEPFVCNEPMKQVPQVTAFMSNKVAICQLQGIFM